MRKQEMKILCNALQPMKNDKPIRSNVSTFVQITFS